MMRSRRGLSPRMMQLVRWYSNGQQTLVALTVDEALAKWNAFVANKRAQTFATPHGRSRRDGTRP